MAIHAFKDAQDGYYQVDVPEGESLPAWTASLTPCDPIHVEIPRWSPDPILNRVRAARDVAAARLDGIAGRMTRSGDTTGIAAACDAAIVALLNITTIPSAKAATNDADLSTALLTEYMRIKDEAGAASPDLIKAFAGFNL